jgi:hypothetical protein
VTLINRVAMLLVAALMAVRPAIGQQQYDRSIPVGGPFSRIAVLNSPFSADATTSIRMLLPDGTARVETLTARYYRDSQGRVRAELDTPWGPYIVVEMLSSEAVEAVPFYRLDPGKRTTYRTFPGYSYAARLFNGEGRIALPVARICFQYAPPVLANASDDERLHAVNAQISPDLGIVTASHRSDGIGVIDYQVTNIRRDEPPPNLFQVENYTFVNGTHANELIASAPWHLPPSCGPARR